MVDLIAACLGMNSLWIGSRVGERRPSPSPSPSVSRRGLNNTTGHFWVVYLAALRSVTEKGPQEVNNTVGVYLLVDVFSFVAWLGFVLNSHSLNAKAKGAAAMHGIQGHVTQRPSQAGRRRRHPPWAPPGVSGAACEVQTHHCLTKCASSARVNRLR